MKKRKLAKKLTLSKETLKSLDAREIERAEGGAGGGTIQPGITYWPVCTQQNSMCIC